MTGIDFFAKNFEASRGALDKAVLTLSSAALGFSVHFLKSLPEGLQTGSCMITLLFAWWAFGLSISSTLLSFASSERHNLLAYNYNNTAEEKRTMEDYNQVMFWNNTTSVMNVISLILLLSGIILFLIYATTLVIEGKL